MNSGDVIKTLAGTSVVLPFANEHPCFGQRQGWCKNLASWRLEGDSLILHFCDACKPRITIHGNWTKLAVTLP